MHRCITRWRRSWSALVCPLRPKWTQNLPALYPLERPMKTAVDFMGDFLKLGLCPEASGNLQLEQWLDETDPLVERETVPPATVSPLEISGPLDSDRRVETTSPPLHPYTKSATLLVSRTPPRVYRNLTHNETQHPVYGENRRVTDESSYRDFVVTGPPPDGFVLSRPFGCDPSDNLRTDQQVANLYRVGCWLWEGNPSQVR